jgi:hypothetical protein
MTLYTNMKKSISVVRRTLSDEYYSRSPNTQSIIKTMVQTIPTSKSCTEYTNTDVYYASSPTTRSNMETYGLVPLNVLRLTHKK